MNYRTPNWRTLTLAAAVALLASGMLAFSKPAVMRVDGQDLDSDVAPITTTQDKVYVPLRALASAIGANTYSEGKTGAVIVVRGNQSVKLTVGDTHATVNGMPMTLKHAPFRVRGRVMIGLKAFARAFGVRVSYDHRTSRIDVTTDGSATTGTDPTE
jgi:hypothetical protein